MQGGWLSRDGVTWDCERCGSRELPDIADRLVRHACPSVRDRQSDAAADLRRLKVGELELELCEKAEAYEAEWAAVLAGAMPTFCAVSGGSMRERREGELLSLLRQLARARRAAEGR